MKRSQLILVSAVLIVIFYLGCQQADNPTQPSQPTQSNGVLSRASMDEDEEESFVISGAVFIDADGDQTRDSNELGLENVTVSILTPDESMLIVLTDAQGNYQAEISETEEEEFEVRIPLSTSDPDDFNDRLDASFMPTTSLTMKFEDLDDDQTGIDFGFKPNAASIISDLEIGALETNGSDFKFWRKQLFFAFKLEKGSPDIDTLTLQAYLDEIEELFLFDPYQFDDDEEFHHAWEIVRTNNPKTPLERLKKELLVAELNYVDGGRGIANEQLFSASILAWGESLVADEEGLSPSLRKVMLAADPGDIESATQILTLMNRPSGPGD